MKYRDADCEVRSFGVYSGSVYPMILLMCLTSYRKNRRAYKKEFEAMLKCEEGDLKLSIYNQDSEPRFFCGHF
ncbi:MULTISPECIES: lysozyme inhibitor LprI family protein [spotted fever group]|nr:hypothetical protein [Rickettsia rickettsii]